MTKLFGRAPAGMNATGESDLQNYYDYVDTLRESVLAPILRRLLPVRLAFPGPEHQGEQTAVLDHVPVALVLYADDVAGREPEARIRRFIHDVLEAQTQQIKINRIIMAYSVEVIRFYAISWTFTRQIYSF